MLIQFLNRTKCQCAHLQDQSNDRFERFLVMIIRIVHVFVKPVLPHLEPAGSALDSTARPRDHPTTLPLHAEPPLRPERVDRARTSRVEELPWRPAGRLAETVTDPAEVDDALRHMLSILGSWRVAV